MKTSKLVEELVRIKMFLEKGDIFSAKIKIDFLIEGICDDKDDQKIEWKYRS